MATAMNRNTMAGNPLKCLQDNANKPSWMCGKSLHAAPRRAAALSGKCDGRTTGTVANATHAADAANAANTVMKSAVPVAAHDSAAANAYDGTATGAADAASDGADAAGNHGGTQSAVYDAESIWLDLVSLSID